MDDATADGSAGPWRNYFLILLYRIPVPIAVCTAYGEVLIANPAMAAEWGAAPGQLRGRNLLDLFRPRSQAQIDRVIDAVRLGRRSRYPVEVRWRAGTDGAEREGELTVDPVGEPSESPPALLALLSVHDDTPPAAAAARDAASPVETRILALAASGATTAAIGSQLGLTVDGVNYHLTRLARRWRVQGRTALVAKAYVLGVLAAGTWPPEPAANVE
ncbi:MULTISPECIES: helix-turn-helix transcriptional regulator [Streptomyces]|uniref:PAS domain-containing protein n=2 Tax=Streptomyces rimosus subsp. rimosus TaxID=132474 RepID=L8ERK1_STRR1|nr:MULTISPECIES: PAS domain-containing protein [Streptomyces]KOG71342.1 diguanylate cyclase [Kitasatospora aureofaciens]MYT43039.1 PAS domain-containing protein [Streptomyces sp. SID5471]KEF08957.1 diguanylate cyclase [Streptomyces rimosus]KOT35665.1 diguanylate cyclase [Streptomyces sp. NRRL WC-3701]KOT40252.1 diguanylate cyclase [Streptomyces rimosus subsp. rimosus]